MFGFLKRAALEFYPYDLRHNLIDQMKPLKKVFPDYKSFKSATVKDMFSDEKLEESLKLDVNILSSSIFINKGEGSFELYQLPQRAQFSPIYSILVNDFDNDGDEDIIAGEGEKVLAWFSDNQNKISDDLVLGECFYLQGLALTYLDQHQEALSAYSCASDLKFITPFVFFNIGNSYRALDNNHLAIEFYEQALELNPDFSECRHNFALALKDRGDHAAAERVLRLLLRDHPETTQAAFSLAELLRESHRNLEAVEAYHLCLNYAPLYCEAWNNLGLTYGSLDQSNDAIASYLQALSIDANYPQSRQNLAQAYVQQKRHHDAINQFKIFFF